MLFSIVLGIIGLILLCFPTWAAIESHSNMVNMLLVLPLSLIYIYACYTSFSNWHGKRYLVGLSIAMVSIFPVYMEPGPTASQPIFLAQDFFGKQLIMYEWLMPWKVLIHFFDYGVISVLAALMLAFMATGFALIEIGSRRYRKIRNQRE